jgi:hypothetical protein
VLEVKPTLRASVGAVGGCRQGDVRAVDVEWSSRPGTVTCACEVARALRIERGWLSVLGLAGLLHSECR